MDKNKSDIIGREHDIHDNARGPQTAKGKWQEPKLRFVEPKLTEQGSVKDLTGGFFGTFSP